MHGAEDSHLLPAPTRASVTSSRTLASGAEAVGQLKEKGLSVEGIAIDLTSDDSISAAAQTLSKKHERIDVLVNNAGICRDLSKQPDLISLRKVYKETSNTNVFGTAVLTEHLVPLLSKSESPRIVFLLSVLGSISDRMKPDSQYAGLEVYVYSTSKTALNMVAATYVKRFREQGWKVNAACPGSVSTGMNGF
ncbi:NAD(P)-binding protein [Bimuria novae-zelandiae CBS 107.79]|uniref:NAD(P)-binding protein n=1 Tax=Bimuria novae-zelandiae CBS 107.79 TaxID=1447943 RepID=A0A6A5VPA9_9PLEO|nr:NAD(P)-binding protein [Bimuria novae-zelandiae CBS 107.79]